MRSSSIVRRGFKTTLGNWTSPIVLGLAAFLAFPNLAARGDLASMVVGLDRSSEQWRIVMTDAPAGAIHTASLTFQDADIGSALAGSGMRLPNGGLVALSSEKDGKAESTPDSERINRGSKKGRVVAVELMQPPKAFSAGSILQRHSMIDLNVPKRQDLAKFSRSKKDRPVELASFYFRREEKKAIPGVSSMVAALVTNRVGDSLATAYAPAEPDFARQSPFDSILKPQAPQRFIPQINPDDHRWAATPLPAHVFSDKEQQCLASGIYFEARGEPVKGQAAVAQVILNRVRNPAYPNTICDVVYQNKDWRNRCQFSFACDRIADRVRSQANWKIAREVAMATTSGKIWLKEVGSSTHYHATYVRPAWARTMKKVGRIGLHVFYRTYGGGWS